MIFLLAKSIFYFLFDVCGNYCIFAAKYTNYYF